MKRTLFFLPALLLCLSCSQQKQKGETSPQKNVKAFTVDTDLRFCEGTVAYQDGILISNFGCDNLDPLNDHGQGYIARYRSDKTMETFIAADSLLNAPKGMAIAADRLYIADVGKVVVYNLKDRSAAPQVIHFPPGELYVNDIAIRNQTAYISVTNTNRIYTLDISQPERLSSENLQEFIRIKGPNGLAFDGKTLYVASYPTDGDITAENVIYRIEDIDDPKPTVFYDVPGEYDGLAINDSRLYFTNWNNSQIGYIDLRDRTATLLQPEGITVEGPADLTLRNDTLYVPDLPASRVIVIPL